MRAGTTKTGPATTDPAKTGPAKTGHCLCGAVRFAYEGRENWRAHCHCESCRRQTASPFTTFMGVPDGAWRWTGVEPAVYVSSPGVRRYFCPTCGAPAAYATDHAPGEIHFYASLLDDAGRFEPRGHVHWGERLPALGASGRRPAETIGLNAPPERRAHARRPTGPMDRAG